MFVTKPVATSSLQVDRMSKRPADPDAVVADKRIRHDEHSTAADFLRPNDAAHSTVDSYDGVGMTEAFKSAWTTRWGAFVSLFLTRQLLHAWLNSWLLITRVASCCITNFVMMNFTGSLAYCERNSIGGD